MSNGTKVNPVGKKWVPEQVLNALKGVAVEKENWLFCGVSGKCDLLELPLWCAWQHLNTASQVFRSVEGDPSALNLQGN